MYTTQRAGVVNAQITS